MIEEIVGLGSPMSSIEKKEMADISFSLFQQSDSSKSFRKLEEIKEELPANWKVKQLERMLQKNKLEFKKSVKEEIKNIKIKRTSEEKEKQKLLVRINFFFHFILNSHLNLIFYQAIDFFVSWVIELNIINIIII